MTRNYRSIIYRYGLAFLIFVAIIAIAVLLRYLDRQINLTIVVTIGLVAASWWGGRGPGIFLTLLVVGTTIVMNPVPAAQSMSGFVFTTVSVLAILLLIVVLISSRRETERRLRDQTDLLSITLSSIGDAMIATDADGKVGFINPAAARLIGSDESDVIGRRLEEVYKVVIGDGAQPQSIFDRVKREQKVFSISDSSFLVNAQDEKVPISDTAAPIIDSSGSFRGAVIVFQDMSERQVAAKAMLEAQARLQQSQKLEAIGTLTGGIAHDFNNLLTAILGFVQLSMLQLGSKSPAYQNMLRVEQAATKGAELTRKLLAFGKRQHLDRKVIDLNSAISEILELLERVIGENISVSFLADARISPVLADPAQIEQIIMNLSINARDAMPTGGRLTIETHGVTLDEYYCKQYPYMTPGKYSQILVSDTGVGMDETLQSHIFEPFFTTKEQDKGTGLGLSMVYGIVKQHGGNINVYSEPGRGTTFKIFMPAVEARLAETTVPQTRLVGGRETVLVAEDEEALRILSGEVLTSLGYTVLMAKDGNEAVELFKQHSSSIDLLLFDVVMPTLGGAEAYIQIREFGNPRVPVIFMTGYSSEILDNPAAADSFDLGGARVIQKPYTLDTLGRTVRDVLDNDTPSPLAL